MAEVGAGAAAAAVVVAEVGADGAHGVAGAEVRSSAASAASITSALVTSAAASDTAGKIEASTLLFFDRNPRTFISNITIDSIIGSCCNIISFNPANMIPSILTQQWYASTDV